MSITTVHVIGKIVTPDGTGVAGGRITFGLSVPGRVEDAGETERVAPRWSVTIASDGTVDFTIIPNDVISPSDTYYNVTYAPVGQQEWSERVVITTLPSTIEIGDFDVIGEALPDTGGRFRPPLFPSGIIAGEQYDGWIWRVPGVLGVNPGAIRTCLVNAAGDTWEFIDLVTGGP
jgi:hypothetical protein